MKSRKSKLHERKRQKSELVKFSWSFIQKWPSSFRFDKIPLNAREYHDESFLAFRDSNQKKEYTRDLDED
jgi:hypothetical protein